MYINSQIIIISCTKYKAKQIIIITEKRAPNKCSKLSKQKAKVTRLNTHTVTNSN